MLWLRQEGDFVATTSRGRYTVYRAGGRTFGAQFKPSGTHAQTRDIGLGNSIGEAKGIAERHALSATRAAAYSRPTSSTRTRKTSNVTRLPRAKSNYKPQSLIFPLDLYTPGEAIRWARSHGYVADKVHITKGKKGKHRTIRLRQFEPSAIVPGTFRVVRFGKGIFAVFGRLKPAAARELRRAA